MDARSVVAVLDDLLAERGEPCFIHLDNGPEFIAFELTDWREEVGVDLYFIEPGSPWFNGKVESFNGRLRDTFSMALNGALFESIAEAQGPLDRWTAGETNTTQTGPTAPLAMFLPPSSSPWSYKNSDVFSANPPRPAAGGRRWRPWRPYPTQRGGESLHTSSLHLHL